jgi:hypothetical protein
VGDELDLAVLSDLELKRRIQLATGELSADLAAGQSGLDAMRAELVRRLRTRHESGQDNPGDDGSSVREPRRPTPLAGTDAIQLQATDDHA